MQIKNSVKKSFLKTPMCLSDIGQSKRKKLKKMFLDSKLYSKKEKKKMPMMKKSQIQQMITNITPRSMFSILKVLVKLTGEERMEVISCTKKTHSSDHLPTRIATSFHKFSSS